MYICRYACFDKLEYIYYIYIQVYYHIYYIYIILIFKAEFSVGNLLM